MNNQYQMPGMPGMPGMQSMPGMGMQQQTPMQQMPAPMPGMQQAMYQPPMQQIPGMPGMPGMQQNQQYANKKPNTTVEVIRSNYTTIGLFEFSGAYDPVEKFPKGMVFVLGVPGLKDTSKQSGRTYNQDGKINMKFSTQEIRSLGQSLINISTFKQSAPQFEKHSDPSKSSHSQGGEQATKKLVAKFDQGKNNITITMNYGQKNVLIPVPLQDAMGLGHDLINVGNFTDSKLAEYKISNRIGYETPTGIDYDPAGSEEPAQPQYQHPAQYAAPQVQAQPMPQAQPQYTPEQIAYFQAQQAGANQQFPGGYPGAQ